MPKQLSAVEYAWNQAGRLRAQRDDARGENMRLRREMENMKYHSELKSDQIDRQADEIRDLRTRLNQLRGTVVAQSEMIQGPRGDSRRRDSNTSSWAQQENSSVIFQTGHPQTPMHQVRPFPSPPTPHAPEQRLAAYTRYPSAIEVIETERRNHATRFLTQTNRQRNPTLSQGNDLTYSYQQSHPLSHSYQRGDSLEVEESVGPSEQPRYQSSRTMTLPYRSASTSPHYSVDSMQLPNYVNSMQPPVEPLNRVIQRPVPVVLKEDSVVTDWQTELSMFFRSVEEWTRRYANVPNVIQADVEESLMQMLSKFTEPDLVGTLLNNADNRYFLVARLINSWITSDLFKPSAFRSFSEAADNKVKDLLHQAQNDTSIETHQALLEAIAAAGKEVTTNAAFGRYVDRQVELRASALWDRVSPLVACEIGDLDVWDHLSNIYREAFRLSALMSCTPLAFTVQYPLVGDHEFFNPATMLNRDPFFLGDPDFLQKQKLRVRLGITPVVFTTGYAHKTVDTGAVHKANVLLMY